MHVAIETPGQVLASKRKGVIVWVAYCARERTLASQQQPHTEPGGRPLRKLTGKCRAILLLKWLCDN